MCYIHLRKKKRDQIHEAFLILQIINHGKVSRVLLYPCLRGKGVGARRQRRPLTAQDSQQPWPHTTPLLYLGPGAPQALHIPLGGSILQAGSRTGHVKVLPKVRAQGHPLPSLTCHPGLCSETHPDSPGVALKTTGAQYR